MLKKNRIHIYAKFLLILILSCVLLSCQSIYKWPHELSKLSSDPAVVYGKLSNGFKYTLMENHNPKNRVSMHLYVQVGSLNETDHEQGFAHFLEHLLFNGSTHFKPGELVKYFQSIGMRFGPDANARTGFNKTVYDLLLPDSSQQSLEKAFVVIEDYAKGALLLESEIDKEKKVVLSEKRARDSVSYRTFVSTLKFELPDALPSKRLPIGKEETIVKADGLAMKEFYDTWYRPDKMMLVMVGDFDTKSTIPLIESKFKNLKARAPSKSEPDFGTISHKGIKPFYHFEKEAGKTSVSIYVIEQISPQPDSKALQQRFLIQDIADQIFQTRLDQIISKPDTPFTSASAHSSGIFVNRIKYTGINANTSGKNWKESLALVEQTLRQALKYGFTQTEFERAKKDLIAELDNQVNQASTRKSQHLARTIISYIAQNRVFMSPVQEKELFVPMINSLTLRELNKIFKESWSPKHRLVLVTGNADLTNDKEKPENQILNQFRASSNTDVLPPKQAKPGIFPYLPEPKQAGAITQKKEIPELGIIQVDFQNNIRLNLKQTDFQANQVQISVGFGKGKSCQPSDLPGLAKLTASIINESGLGSLDKEQLNAALAGKSTNLVFKVKEDRFYFQGKTIPQEIPLLFQLIYAHLKDPGFSQDAYKLVMERFAQTYQKLSSSIQGGMTLSGKRFFAGGDNRFGLPLYQKFKTLTLDQVQAWIEPILKQGILEVSVVGDFDVDSLIKTASLYVGSLNKRKNITTKSDTGSDTRQVVFPEGESKQILVKTKIPKALVVIGYPSQDFWNIKRTRRLNILAQIFSNQLHEKIREKLGAAYSPYAYNMASRAYKGYGILQAFITLAPDQTDFVEKQVKEIASELVKNGVTIDELKRALNPTLSFIKDMLDQNNYWLNQVLSGSRDHPEQLEWNRTILKDYSDIKPAELSILAKEYLNNRKIATLVVKPLID